MGLTTTAGVQRKGKGIHVTREQKSILKDAFKFIPYPDHYPDSLNKLSADTGLDQEAIKKWFRNRRKKMGSKNASIENDESEDIIDIQVDNAKKVADESLNESNGEAEVVNHHAELAGDEPTSSEAGDEPTGMAGDQPTVDAGDEPTGEAGDEPTGKAGDEPTVEAGDEPTGEAAAENIPELKTANNVSDELDSSVSENAVEEKSDRVIEKAPVVPSVKSGGKIIVPSTSMDNATVSDDLMSVNSNESDVPVEKENDEVPVEGEKVYEDNNDDNERVTTNEGEDEMSTEEKAVQYDVLKNEFSSLQGKFEGLAKILGSHGIDIGGESLPPALPSTSQQPVPAPADAEPAYYPPVQGYAVPKQEPPYGWDYNLQWMQQYPPYPQSQAYPSYSYPYYHLPYPPPDHPIYPIPHHNPYPQNLPPPHPADHAILGLQPASKPSSKPASKPARAKVNQKRTCYSKDVPYLSNEVLEPSHPVDEATTDNFMGDMLAPKKSFQGPSSNKLKRKSDPIPPSAPAQPSTLPGPSQPKQSRVQTLYPPSQQAVPSKNTRRKSMPIKLKPGTTHPKPITHPKLGTHPKPLTKTVPLHEQSLQANNPFRQNKKSVGGSSRAQPQVQTLFPPGPGSRPEVEYVSTLPSLGSGITVQKVLNPLDNPNKPQELKKVLAMSNLSVSLARK